MVVDDKNNWTEDRRSDNIIFAISSIEIIKPNKKFIYIHLPSPQKETFTEHILKIVILSNKEKSYLPPPPPSSKKTFTKRILKMIILNYKKKGKIFPSTTTQTQQKRIFCL